MDEDWLVFDPRPSKPEFRLPPGAVDAHCHVFGPGDRFPYAPERKYTPCDASAAQLFALRDHLGFARNVIVQATCHGADNRAMLDALRQSGGRARGVATVRAEVTDAELKALDAAGVRGVAAGWQVQHTAAGLLQQLLAGGSQAGCGDEDGEGHGRTARQG